LWLPTLQAQSELDHQDPTAALKTLQAAQSPLEFGVVIFGANAAGSCLYSSYVRGQAYLAAGDGNAAAAEFQKILDRPGIVWNCWTGPLAQLGKLAPMFSSRKHWTVWPPTALAYGWV